MRSCPFHELTIDDYVGVSIYDLKALSELIKSIAAKNCLELGTFMGNGSTTMFYAAGVNLTCVDHWRGNENNVFMQAKKNDYNYFDICKRTIVRYDHENHITLINADTREAVKLDFVTFFTAGFRGERLPGWI